MTNIIQIRQEQRESKIRSITDSLFKAMSEGRGVLYEEILSASMSNLHISRRTAAEYLEVALFRLKMRKEDLVVPEQKKS